MLSNSIHSLCLYVNPLFCFYLSEFFFSSSLYIILHFVLSVIYFLVTFCFYLPSWFIFCFDNWYPYPTQLIFSLLFDKRGFFCSFINCSIFLSSSLFRILWSNINVAYCTFCSAGHVLVCVDNPTYVIIKSWNISFKVLLCFFLQVLSFPLSWCLPMLSSHK